MSRPPDLLEMRTTVQRELEAKPIPATLFAGVSQARSAGGTTTPPIPEDSSGPEEGDDEVGPVEARENET
jgi:hypothetical protein